MSDNIPDNIPNDLLIKPHKKGAFVKGDPRINRKGRPKTFNGLRELAQAIANETAVENGEPIVINGQTITIIERILRSWANSNTPVLQKSFVEIAYGKDVTW